MQIRTLVHKNYRGLKDDALSFDKVNHIIGKNGCGKTSIIEAAVLLLSGRSFQGATIKELTNKNKVAASLHGTVFLNTNNVYTASLVFDGKKKKHTLNNKREGQQHAHKTFPLCLIDTNAINASSGQPKFRRDLLDRAVFHVEPQHATNHKKLNKCLSQRNKAISKREGRRAIQSWDEPLAEAGEKISEARQLLLNEAATHLNEISNELLGIRVQTRFHRGWDRTTLIDSLKESLNKDMALKRTSCGPQKEDYKLMAAENKTKGYFSHGQEKLSSIALLLALNNAVEKRKKTNSIIIIDEAESGLDETANNKLFSLIKNLQNQLLITSLPHHLASEKIEGNILHPAQK